MIAFFALIGMAVSEDSVPKIREAITDMAKRSVRGPYIIAFGNNPDDVHTTVLEELGFTNYPDGDTIWH